MSDKYTPEQLNRFRAMIQPMIEVGWTPQKIVDNFHTQLSVLLIEQGPGVAFDMHPAYRKLSGGIEVLRLLYPQLANYKPVADRDKVQAAINRSAR